MTTAEALEEALLARFLEHKIEGDEPIVEDEDDEDNEDDEDDIEGSRGGTSGRYKQSRSERMTWKYMQQLGMKTIAGVRRVTLEKNDILVVITKPDVFKCPNSDTYVIFENAKLNYLERKEKQQSAGQKAPDLSNIIMKAEPVEDKEEVDESSVDPEDIELVMTQAFVPRSTAVKALKTADGDIVAVIMELTN